MTLIELAEKVKFKLEYIYIAGFDSFGHRIKACVCYIPTQSNKGNYERYAYVKSDDDLLLLRETYLDNKFELTYSVPKVMWYAFKEQYVNKLTNLEKKLADHILGKKVEELRSRYTYNPFLKEPDSLPWWYTMKDLDERDDADQVVYGRTEPKLEDKPLLEKVYANKKKAVKFKASMSMAKRFEKLNNDAMLIIEANDAKTKKVHL